MDEKISVLEIEIDRLLAKEALKQAIEYMDSRPIHVIDIVTADALMQIKEVPGLKEEVGRFDLVLAGDRTILEATGVAEKRVLKETQDRAFFKMLMRYLHKRHKRIYLLVESEQEGADLYEYLEHHYSGLQIVGLAKVFAEDRADDMIVNAVNGGEADCIFAALSTPLQEEFIVDNKNLLNVGLWLGFGRESLCFDRQRSTFGKVTDFISKHTFKKEIEKQKNKK